MIYVRRLLFLSSSTSTSTSTSIVNLSGRRLHALHEISKSFHPCVSPRSTFCWPCFSARSFHCLFFPRLSSANTQYTWAMENSPMVVLDMSSSADSNTRRTGMCCILSLRNFTWGGRTDHIRRRPGVREKTRQHTRFALGSSGPSSLAFGRRPQCLRSLQHGSKSLSISCPSPQTIRGAVTPHTTRTQKTVRGG